MEQVSSTLPSVTIIALLQFETVRFTTLRHTEMIDTKKLNGLLWMKIPHVIIEFCDMKFYTPKIKELWIPK